MGGAELTPPSQWIGFAKFAFTMKTPQTVSISNLKANTGRILREISRGKSLTITRRRKPLARLVPLASTEAVVSGNDGFFRLAELAEPMGALTNEQIDQLVYGG